MYDLRKRRRLNDDSNRSPVLCHTGGEVSLTNRESTQPSQVKLDGLPSELFYTIFVYLKLDDILRLRATSARFKHLIDGMAFVWCRVALRFRPTNMKNGRVIGKFRELGSFLNFYHANASLDLIRMTCPDQLSNRDLLAAAPANHDRFRDSSCELHVDQFNVSSFRILNLFADFCTELNIRSFFVFQATSINSTNTTFKCGQVRRLSLNLVRSCSTLYWSNCFNENVLLNRLAHIFPHVQEVHLSYYLDDGRDLLDALCDATSLRVLSLSCSTFRLNPIKPFRKLRLDTLILDKVSLATARYCIANLADDDHDDDDAAVVRLTHLVLFVGHIGHDQDGILPDLLELLSSGIFANILTLSTNMFHVGRIRKRRLEAFALAWTSMRSLELRESYKSELSMISRDDSRFENLKYKCFQYASKFLSKFDEIRVSMHYLKHLKIQFANTLVHQSENYSIGK